LFIGFLLISNMYISCRKARGALYKFFFLSFRFTDKEWPRQWYLNRGGDLDMNVEEAWDMGRPGSWVGLRHGYAWDKGRPRIWVGLGRG
jgi:hypothetical protein